MMTIYLKKDFPIDRHEFNFDSIIEFLKNSTESFVYIPIIKTYIPFTSITLGIDVKEKIDNPRRTFI